MTTDLGIYALTIKPGGNIRAMNIRDFRGLSATARSWSSDDHAWSKPSKVLFSTGLSLEGPLPRKVDMQLYLRRSRRWGEWSATGRYDRSEPE